MPSFKLQQLLIFLTVPLMSGISLAEEVIVADDGSEILLKDDGSWIQLSRDRFATNKQGNRICLKPDGSWEIVVDESAERIVSKESSIKNAAPARTDAIVPNRGYRLLLASAEYLKTEEKTIKSKRVNTRTVFYLSLENSANKTIRLDTLSTAQFNVKASNGRDFKVLDIEAEQTALAPGERTSISLTVDGTPRWFNVKYFNVTVDAETFGSSAAQILSINTQDIESRKVDSF